MSDEGTWFSRRPELTPEQRQQQIDDRDRAYRAARFAADQYAMDRQVRALPGADQTAAAVTAALGYLIGHGLITVKPADEWPEWLDLDVPEHLAPDVDGMVERYAAMQAAMRQGGRW